MPVARWVTFHSVAAALVLPTSLTNTMQSVGDYTLSQCMCRCELCFKPSKQAASWSAGGGVSAWRQRVSRGARLAYLTDNHCGMHGIG